MDKLPRIPSPPGTLWREFRVTLLPFVVFAVVLTVTIFTWRNYVGPSALVGEVEAVRASVNSPLSGRLVQLSVHLMERVSKGQVLGQVAVTDPRIVQANLALSKARIDLIRASPVSELRLENSQINYENLRLHSLEQRLALATSKSDLNYYQAEFERTSQLFDAHLESQSALDLARKKFDSTRTKIAEQTKVVEESERTFQRMKVNDLPPAVDGVPVSIQASIVVEERNLALLEAQLAPQPLISPIDGIVSAILHHEGEGVPAGQPVLTVSGITADRIIAYVRQPLNFAVRTNLAVEVRARSYKRDVAVGSILSVGRQLEAIQPQLLPLKPMNGATIEYGLPILVSVPKGMTVLPGEIVDLRPLTD
jgi:multidrug resistance efflux pump